MIWQQHSKVIVMLTRLSEGVKGKADIYWPEEGCSIIFDGLEVTCVSSHFSPECQIHTRVMRLDYQGESMLVTHLQLENWPDFGVPASTHSVLHLSTTISNLHLSAPTSPITLHCSAGLGRTGTFAAIHSLITTQGGSVPEVVRRLRESRPGSVQTLQQYLFIYQVMADWRKSSLDRLEPIEPCTHILTTVLESKNSTRRKIRAPESPLLTERCSKTRAGMRKKDKTVKEDRIRPGYENKGRLGQEGERKA